MYELIDKKKKKKKLKLSVISNLYLRSKLSVLYNRFLWYYY